MFKNFFALKKKGGGETPGVKPRRSPKEETNSEEPDGEYQIPFLKRNSITMTADLMRRMEEEKLCREYQLSPTKTGTFI